MKLENNQIREEELERVEEAVFVIDMINGFVKFGPLAAPSIMRVVPFQQEILEESENKPNSINVFGDDEHTKDSVEFNTFGIHAVKGDNETKIITELDRWFKTGLEFKKNSTNLMFAPGVITLLEKLRNLKKVYIVGCLSEVCVKNFAISLRNYFDEVNRNIDVNVYKYGIDTYDAPGHNADEVTETSLQDMKINGVKVLKRTRKLNKVGDGINENI